MESMKRKMTMVVITAVAAGLLVPIQAQVQPATGKTLAATLNIYVFPTTAQTPEQQSKDEAECYQWAVQNTGTDPFKLAEQTEQQKQQAAQAQQQAQQAGKGAGAQGAVKGAAAGALIGEIANDDAGEGAAWGAAAGAVAGRRRSKAAKKEASASAEKQSAEAEAALKEQETNFKKAFSVCLEAKKYMVKY
jgi:hypothetical protein